MGLPMFRAFVNRRLDGWSLLSLSLIAPGSPSIGSLEYTPGPSGTMELKTGSGHPIGEFRRTSGLTFLLTSVSGGQLLEMIFDPGSDGMHLYASIDKAELAWARRCLDGDASRNVELLEVRVKP